MSKYFDSQRRSISGQFREEKLAYLLKYVDLGFVVQCHEHVKNQTLAFVKKKLFRNIWQLGVKSKKYFVTKNFLTFCEK